MPALQQKFQKWIRQSLIFGLDAHNADGFVARIFIEQTSGEQHTIGIGDNHDEFDEEGFLETAREFVSGTPGIKCYAIVWTGTVSLPDDTTAHAILTEAAERDGPAVVMAQPIRKKGNNATAQGNVIEVCVAENYIDREVGDDGEDNEVSEEDSERLSRLVSEVISEAFKRLEAGNEMPLALVSRLGQEAFGVYEPESEDGEFIDLLNSVRDSILDDEDAHQYAVAYLGTDEVDGELIEGLYVEAADQNGQETTYFKRYSVSKSGKVLPADDMQIYEQDENLWVSASEEDDESNEEESEPGELDQLVERVFSIAVDRLQEGNNKPWACFADTADEPLSILDPGDTDASSEEILEVLRQHVATLDQPRMYSIVFSLTQKTGGKDIHIIVVEAGERDGEAPVFGLPYKILKSGKVQHEEIEFSCMIDNLWS